MRDIIIPKIKALCPAFPWRDSEFVVRDAGWVNLSTYPSSEAYFYKDCMTHNAKSSKPVFKTRAFDLMVVVLASQWLEYNTFIEGSGAQTTSQAPLAVNHGLQVIAESTDSSISHHHREDTSLFAPEDNSALADSAPRTMTSKKCGHRHVHSSDSIITNEARLPAPKRLAAATIVSESPPRDAIRQALEKGGSPRDS